MNSRYITGAALVAAMTLVPSAAWAGTTTTTPPPVAPATTSAPAPTAPATTSAAKPATTAPIKVRTYDVISGTYVKQAKADARAAAMASKHVSGMSVVTIGTKHLRYRVEEKGLDKAAARTLSKALRAAGFTNHIVVE